MNNNLCRDDLLTTLLVLIMLIAFGGTVLKPFAVIMTLGTCFGVYSSIYISNQLWLFLEIKRVSTPNKDKKDDDDINELEVKGINC